MRVRSTEPRGEYLTDDVCEKLWSSVRDASGCGTRLYWHILILHSSFSRAPREALAQPDREWSLSRARWKCFSIMLKNSGRRTFEFGIRIWTRRLLYEWEYIIKLLLRTIITTGVVESYSTTYSPRVRDVSLRMTAAKFASTVQ